MLWTYLLYIQFLNVIMYVYQYKCIILLWQLIIQAKNIMKWITVYIYCIYSYIPVDTAVLYNVKL